MLTATVLAGAISQAEVVHVYERRSLNGVTTTLSDRTVNTGVKYTSVKAAAVDGYIFTHWSISTTQVFENRTPWGCAYNYVEFIPYEATILTANYVPASRDSDGDGMADGYELYWYGNLSKNPSSDTDGDGYTFQQEITYGMNPHFFDEEVKAGVAHEWSDKLLYNPYGYCSYTVRSQPEGALFETSTDWVRPGTTITSPKCNRMTTTFAYWMKNGVQQRDEFGRAVNSFSFAMPEENVELVAVCEPNADLREQLYWYGAATSLNSDTDEDGYYLFEEIAMGTSPLFPDEHTKGVVWQQSEKLLYNPYSYQSYVVRSEPEGALFETITEWVRPGTEVETKKLDHQTTTFAQWLRNGVRQQDEFGRAVPQVAFAMPSNAVELVAETRADETTREKIYWYGDTSVSMDSDTDGDGITFANEIRQGTSPLFPNETVKAGVVYDEAEGLEVNLQPYEQVVGAIVDGKYVELFTSPTAGNEAKSQTFGGAVTPVVADLNGDGLFDIVVVWEGTQGTEGTNVWINVGSKGNPEFEASDGGLLANIDLGMNDLRKLPSLTLDIQPVGALSASTNGTTLLVSDAAGRIWYYEDGRLQHKVWGGSYAGFANGLKLAAVDWEDDGDLDCLCGTAEGKLMLLRNPKVGRPTNVHAAAGVDNVLLTWDPNQQSRVRGYRVYRDNAPVTSVSSVSSVPLTTALPTYRDTGLAPGDYGYEVSALSRFYITGNSTPMVTESMRTAAITATVGQVTFVWRNAKVKLGEQVGVTLSIDNSLHYDAAGKSQKVVFDPEYLTFVGVEKSGITDELVLTTGCIGGELTVNVVSGSLKAGSGDFLTFVFDTRKAGTTLVGNAEVEIVDNPVVPFIPGDLDGDGDVDKDDQNLLAQFMQSAVIKYTPEQLRAGDLNHNGRLDNGDFQIFKDMIKNQKKEGK